MLTMLGQVALPLMPYLLQLARSSPAIAAVMGDPEGYATRIVTGNAEAADFPRTGDIQELTQMLQTQPVVGRSPVRGADFRKAGLN
jgi:hypothetical protein